MLSDLSRTPSPQEVFVSPAAESALKDLSATLRWNIDTSVMSFPFPNVRTSGSAILIVNQNIPGAYTGESVLLPNAHVFTRASMPGIPYLKPKVGNSKVKYDEEVDGRLVPLWPGTGEPVRKLDDSCPVVGMSMGSVTLLKTGEVSVSLRTPWKYYSISRSGYGECGAGSKRCTFYVPIQLMAEFTFSHTKHHVLKAVSRSGLMLEIMFLLKIMECFRS